MARRNEVRVDEADAASRKAPPRDELEELSVTDDGYSRETTEGRQHYVGLAQVAEGEFPDDEGVRDDETLFESRGERGTLLRK